tara:strand:+ start:1657 stop:1836 length:180 start_codon:yes stop_codon:yes gene_type:complete
MNKNNELGSLKREVKFWEKTDTWREEPDFWRLGIMKKMPVLLSLSIIMLTGVILTIFLR